VHIDQGNYFSMFTFILELTKDSVPGCTQSQTFTSDVQGNSSKRLRTQLTAEEEPPSFTPPENPCFLNGADVGRTWHYTRRNDKRHRNRSIPFKIVTYNVLADSLLKSHSSLYDECSAWCLEWEYRKKNLLKEILHYNADVSRYLGTPFSISLVFP
jgi:hypothetical protein